MAAGVHKKSVEPLNCRLTEVPERPTLKRQTMAHALAVYSTPHKRRTVYAPDVSAIVDCP